MEAGTIPFPQLVPGPCVLVFGVTAPLISCGFWTQGVARAGCPSVLPGPLLQGQTSGYRARTPTVLFPCHKVGPLVQGPGGRDPMSPDQEFCKALDVICHGALRDGTD